MTATVKAIIWDMVGVLLREEDPAPRIKLAGLYGLDVKVMNDLIFSSHSAGLATNGAISEEEHWNWVASQLGIQPEYLQEFQLRFWDGSKFDGKLADFIASLKQSYKTSLLSNAWSGTRNQVVEYFGRLDIFDEVLISAEIKLAKPDPEIFWQTLNVLQVQPHEAIFVDDTLENVTAANDLGIFAIHFKTAEQAMADVRSLLG